ncbi:MAG TPA: hypothetical protein PLX56_02295 [bacterium]|nr:hypothetical protein [bacterium]
MKKIIAAFSVFFTVVSCQQISEKKEQVDKDSITETEQDSADTDEAVETPDADLSEEIIYNCDEFKIKDIENIEENGMLFYRGSISNINGDAGDIIKFSFLNSDGSWNYQIEETSYDLGNLNNSDAYTCSECLWVLSDVSNGKPAKLYFQESGTFEVSEAGPGIQAKGRISARLIEVAIKKSSVVPVKNGSCIEIENGEIDLFCYPECVGKVCGNNGCGGICGDGCKDDEYCSDDQSECIKYNCTEFTIETLESIEFDRKYLYNAKISNIDNESEDFIKFRFYNEDRSWNYQIEEKVYDLGSIDNSDPYTCMECLWVYSDIIDENPQKYYFQQSGTFEVDEAGLIIEAAGTLNARLVEMEIDENEKFVPVSEGDCIEIKNGLINTLCEKQCDGKVCGPDSCGGICGDGCGNDEYYSEDQTECIEYDCKNVTVKSGMVHLGEGPGSYFEYEMGVYMEFNEFLTYSQYEDYFSVEIWDKLPPAVYNIKEVTSIYADAASYIGETGTVVYDFMEESGKIEIVKVDYNKGLFEAEFHKLRMVEYYFGGTGYFPVIGGKCIEINGTVSASLPTFLKQEVQ